MASLMCGSLSLFVKVAPVSGQVKYTPDTERQVAPLAGNSASLKKKRKTISISRIRSLASLLSADLDGQTSTEAAFSLSPSEAASASSSLLTGAHRKSHP